MFARWVDVNGICLCFGLLVFSLLPVDLVYGWDVCFRGMCLWLYLVVCVFSCVVLRLWVWYFSVVFVSSVVLLLCMCLDCVIGV